NDTVVLDFGKFKSHAIKANLDVKVLTQKGDDTVAADFGDCEGQSLSFTASLGDGKDSCVANRWGILRGTRSRFDVLGEGGDDTLRFYTDNGAWASATEDARLRGGDGADNLSLFFDDAVVSRYAYSMAGGKGNDTLTCEQHVRAGDR